MRNPRPRVAVLGASGGVGRLIAQRLIDAGAEVACQTRDAAKLASLAGRAEVQAFDPRDAAKLETFVAHAEAVIFALGTDAIGPTTLFSDVTAALLPAMRKHRVRRLVAITGVGAGETRGHGGFLYDRIIFPLFTRRRYRDKDRQEALIAASDLDWTIVRPAPFTARPVPGPLIVLTEIEPHTRLTRITREEVADFVVAQIHSGEFSRQRPFIGHG
jgi:putative NADH-flavin reductase